MTLVVRKLVCWTVCLAVFLGLSTQAFAQNSVTLTWNANTDSTTTGYRVHYGTVSQSYPNTISAGSATSVTVTNLTAGTTYYFAVGAYGSLGVEGSYSPEITYTVPVARPTPPTVTLTSPASGASFTSPATVNLAASVVANGYSIAKVQFYSNGTLLGEDTAPPYIFTWNNAASGNYSLVARVVYDGTSTVDSSPASVVVSGVAPIVTITSPADAANFKAPATVSLAATVTANGHTINKIGFYSSTQLIVEQTSAPYAVTLTNLGAGTYYFRARVTYDTTNSVTSTVSINVQEKKKAILTIAADSGTITSPFTTNNGTVSQAVSTTLTGSGRAAYNFTVSKSGDYTLSAMVNAATTSENSLYVNIDAEPTDPMCIWNLGVTTNSTDESVTWQGVSNLVPKVFYLTAGSHQLIVRGREPNSRLGTISVWAAPFNAKVNSSRQAVLTGVGRAGHTYDVQASQNLKTWTTIGSVAIGTDGSFQFTDPTPATYASRSYRLVIH